MRMPSRRTFWLSAATLLVAVVASAWVVMPRSRITQANFDRIQKGMSLDEVTAILSARELGSASLGVAQVNWHEGENWISVDLEGV